MEKDDFGEFLKGVILEKDTFFVPDKEVDQYLEGLFISWVGQGMMSDTEAKEIIIRIAEIAKEGFYDKRFNLPNRSFLKYEIRLLLSQIIREAALLNQELNVDLINSFGGRFGIIFLDVNGLKSVNDVFSHAKGDVYLELFASKVIPERNDKLAAFLKKYRLSHFVASAGGDEMVLIIYFKDWRNRDCQSLSNFLEDNGIKSNLLKRALDLIQEGIEEINLSKELEINLANLKKKLGVGVPDDFIWYGSAPASFCSFEIWEWIEHLRCSSNNKRKLYLLMDAVFTSVEREAKEEKRLFKEALRKSENLRNRVTYEIITRTEESLELFREVLRLKEQLRELKKQYNLGG